MYSDPANIRSHVVKLRLNDNEAALVEAAADRLDSQTASYAREALMSAVVARLQAAGFNVKSVS